MAPPSQKRAKQGVERINSLTFATNDPLLDGFLDDLISIGSNPQASGELSVPDSPGSPSSWRLTNPVHMELQENAKLPTFNLPVNREGSAYASRQGPNGNNTRDSSSANLAELFLSSSSRRSLDANYERAGILRRDSSTQPHIHRMSFGQAAASSSPETGSAGEAQAVNDKPKVDDPLDALAAEVEPTPLSEIRRKAEQRHPPYQSQSYGSSVNPSASSYRQHNHGYRREEYYPYGGRQYQLPIPSSVPSSPPIRPSPPSPRATVQNGVAGATSIPPAASIDLSEAVATAAAIASQNSPPSSAAVAPTFAKRDFQRSSFTPLRSIEHASKHKTQYGFGSRHRVPSVPGPPESAARSSSKKRKVKEDDSSGTAQVQQHTEKRPHSASPTSGGGLSSNTNSGAAYERKKQRAKDARVKLNEAIEHLSIAINLAGSQSKQRMIQWQSLPSSPSSLHHRQAGVKLIQDCMRTAEGAKKWDRPNFVASAAALLEALNSQCECLMKELTSFHEQHSASLKNGIVVNGSSHSPGDKRPSSASSDASPTNDGRLSPVDGLPLKRQRVDGAMENGHGTELSLDDSNWDKLPPQSRIFLNERVVSLVARFLGPLSLVRCNQVCKTWRKSFSRCDAWQDMSIERFGYYNVRQWRGKLDDEDEGISCVPLTLYRSMDTMNVMPHFNHEGMFLLGEARIPGKVSAWTFLVERSNGETLRTVRRQESSPDSAMYTSLPIVELRTIIQNTGSYDEPVVIKDQLQTVDASTRRRGSEMKEIDWDDRFKKRVLNLDGTARPMAQTEGLDVCRTLCQLKLFEAVVIETYIHAKGCSTTSKFVQKSNFTKLLIQLRSGTTVPLVMTFPRDISHHLEH